MTTSEFRDSLYSKTFKEIYLYLTKIYKSDSELKPLVIGLLEEHDVKNENFLELTEKIYMYNMIMHAPDEEPEPQKPEVEVVTEVPKVMDVREAAQIIIDNVNELREAEEVADVKTFYDKGLSPKEIEAEEHKIFDKYPERFAVYKIMSEDEIKHVEELSARRVINSCIYYDEDYRWYNVKTKTFGESIERYKKYFSEKYLKALYFQQRNAIATRAKISMSDFDEHIFNYRNVKWDDEE